MAWEVNRKIFQALSYCKAGPAGPAGMSSAALAEPGSGEPSMRRIPSALHADIGCFCVRPDGPAYRADAHAVGQALVVKHHHAEFIHAFFDLRRLFSGKRLRDVDTGCLAAKERARNGIDRADG